MKNVGEKSRKEKKTKNVDRRNEQNKNGLRRTKKENQKVNMREEKQI